MVIETAPAIDAIPQATNTHIPDTLDEIAQGKRAA